MSILNFVVPCYSNEEVLTDTGFTSTRSYNRLIHEGVASDESRMTFVDMDRAIAHGQSSRACISQMRAVVASSSPKTVAIKTHCLQGCSSLKATYS